MTATTDLGSDLGFGLSDTDFGAGLVTLVAALGHDPRDLQEAALVETVGVLDGCVRWVQSEIAVRVAELARRRGGATDEAAAVDALLAAQGPVRSGRELRPRFWEQTVLGARLRLSEWDARRLVSTSVALFGDGPGGRLPSTAAALGAGEISWAHADALAAQTAELSAADAAAVEVGVLADRRAVTVGQFRHRAKARVDQLRPPAEPAPRAGTASTWELADGTIRLDAALDPDGGRILARAIDAYATVTGPDDTRSAERRRADALVEIGQLALDQLDPARGATITRTGRHPHLMLLGDTRTGRTTLDGAGYVGPAALDPWAADRLTCCADVQTAVVDEHGRVVGLGDLHRRMPGTRLRREIALRDQGCRWPGCTRPVQRCRPHHVTFHSDGGPTVAENLLSLCEVHHEAIHRDGWHLRFDGSTATFTDPHGRTYDSPPPLARARPTSRPTAAGAPRGP